MERKTTESAMANVRTRLSCRLWSCEKIDEMDQLGRLDFNICKGHNYYVAVINDRLVNEGAGKIVNKSIPDGVHHITEEQSGVMFEVNKDRCFWDRSSVAELTKMLPTPGP